MLIRYTLFKVNVIIYRTVKVWDNLNSSNLRQIRFCSSQIRKGGIDDTVVIDAEDTDVIILSAIFAHEIDGYLGIKWNKNIFDCRKLMFPKIFQRDSSALLSHTSRCSFRIFLVMVKNQLWKTLWNCQIFFIH